MYRTTKKAVGFYQKRNKMYSPSEYILFEAYNPYSVRIQKQALGA